MFYAVDDILEEQGLYRPKDFKESRKWVKHNVPEGNQYRLLEALDKLEQDKTLVFHFSH